MQAALQALAARLIAATSATKARVSDLAARLNAQTPPAIQKFTSVQTAFDATNETSFSEPATEVVITSTAVIC